MTEPLRTWYNFLCPRCLAIYKHRPHIPERCFTCGYEFEPKTLKCYCGTELPYMNNDFLCCHVCRKMVVDRVPLDRMHKYPNVDDEVWVF